MATFNESTKVSQSVIGIGNTAGTRTNISPISTPATGNRKPTKVIDNSAPMMRDMGKLFGKGVQGHQDASEYSGTVSGDDNFVEFKKGMSNLESHYSAKENMSVGDTFEKDRLTQGLFEYYMQKGAFGKNAVANDAFKKTYGRPAMDAVNRAKINNADERFKLMGVEEDLDWKDRANAMRSQITMRQVLDTRGRYYGLGMNGEIAEDIAANSLNLEFNEYLGDGKTIDIFDADGNVSTDKVNKWMMSFYGNFLKVANSDIKSVKDLKEFTYDKTDERFGDKAAQKMLQNWKAGLSKALSAKGKNGHQDLVPYKIALRQVKDSVGAGVLPTADNLAVLQDDYKDKISNNLLISDSSRESLEVDYNDTLIAVGNVVTINEQLNKGIPHRESWLAFEANGSSRTASTTRGTVDTTMNGALYAKVFQQRVANMDEGASGMKMDTPDEREKFASALGMLNSMNRVHDKPSKLFVGFDQSLSGAKNPPNDLNSMRQLHSYLNMQRQTNDKYSTGGAGLSRQLGEVLYNENLSDVEKMQRADVYVNTYAKGLGYKATQKVMSKTVSDALKGEFKRTFGVNAELTDLSATISVFLGHKDLSPSQAKQWLAARSTTDVGAWVSFDTDQMIVNPQGVDSGDVDRALRLALKIQNNHFKRTIKSTNLHFKPNLSGGDIGYTVEYQTDDGKIVHIMDLNKAVIDKFNAVGSSEEGGMEAKWKDFAFIFTGYAE